MGQLRRIFFQMHAANTNFTIIPMIFSGHKFQIHETMFANVLLRAGAKIPLDTDHEERAVYVVDGTIDIAGDKFEPGRLLVFKPGDKITITAASDTHFVILGGASMDGPRHIWWNFVSSRKERIEQAKAEWKAGHFGKVPGDEIEFIPLPEK